MPASAILIISSISSGSLAEADEIRSSTEDALAAFGL